MNPARVISNAENALSHSQSVFNLKAALRELLDAYVDLLDEHEHVSRYEGDAGDRAMYGE